VLVIIQLKNNTLYGFNRTIQKDSTEIVHFVSGLKTYYRDPLFYKNNIAEIEESILIKLKKNPNSEWLNLNLASLYDFKAFFEGFSFDFDDALKMLLKAESIKKKYNYYYDLPATYRGIGRLWRSQKDYKKEKQYLLLGLDTAKKYANYEEELKCQSGLTMHQLQYYEENNPKKIDSVRAKALENYQIMADKAVKHSLYSVAGNAYSQMSRLSRLLGKIEESKSFIELSSMNYEKDKNVIGQEKALFSLATYYRKSGDGKQSIKILRECIEKVKILGDSTALKTRYLAMSNTGESIKDYKLAYDYYVLYKDITDSRTNAEHFIKLVNQENDFKLKEQRTLDSLKLEKNKILFAQKADFNNKLKYVGIINVLIFVGIAFLVLFLINRIKKIRAENLVIKKNVEILELGQRIDIKRQQVGDLISENLAQISSKEKILEQLNQMSKETVATNNNDLKSLINELKAEKIEDDRSKILKKDLGLINYEFIEKLKLSYPELTKTEIEMASFIKLGLNLKQITVLRNVSLDAVKKSRSRLRIKLNIESSDKLKDFFNNF